MSSSVWVVGKFQEASEENPYVSLECSAGRLRMFIKVGRGQKNDLLSDRIPIENIIELKDFLVQFCYDETDTNG